MNLYTAQVKQEVLMQLSHDRSPVSTYMPVRAIFSVKDAVTSNFAAVPSNCQLRTALPFREVYVLLTFPRTEICIIQQCN